jgi:four helix bundle protein
MSESILKEKSLLFAIRIVMLYKSLKENQREYVLSKQLLRSGTSVGAMICEAKNSESKADFQHKLGIAQKECDESTYWLELLNRTNYITENEFNNLRYEANELLKMIRSSILTSKSNGKK